MFDFLKRKKQPTENAPADNVVTEKKSLIAKLKSGLTKTRTSFTSGLANIFLGKKTIDAELLTTLEDILLTADVGVTACQEIIADLTTKISRKQLNDVTTLYQTLKQDLQAILLPCEKPLAIPAAIKPYAIVMVGVNGAGKTTTIGKLAKRLESEGKKVMLAAGDTFRAAAIEQLSVWGERNNIPVIAQLAGADSAAVAFDAFQAAKTRNCDVVIIDTAGRLHTKTNLMDELKKMRKVLAKLDPDAPHEVMLVLDASNGQNSINQAREFQTAVGVTSIVLTKLDGTAKGGIIFALAKNLKLPIPYIGVGESIDDLQPFNAANFVDALFDE